jgi:hypothetical protein
MNSSDHEQSLRRVFSIILLSKKQLRYWACILSVVPITFHMVIPLLDAIVVRLHSLENSREMVSWSSSTFWLLLKRQLSSWWEIPSLLSMNFVIIDNILDFLSSRTCPCYGCNLLSSLYYVLPWSITVFYVKDVVRIAPPLRNSWYSDTSHHHHSFLVPMLILTGIPICKRCCLDSVLLATLLLWS